MRIRKDTKVKSDIRNPLRYLLITSSRKSPLLSRQTIVPRFGGFNYFMPHCLCPCQQKAQEEQARYKILQAAENSQSWEAISFCCDFGGKLESLRLLSISRIFCHSRMAKKGVCLARCTGELHPGPSGWIQVNAEALDFLTFRRAEQQKDIASQL